MSVSVLHDSDNNLAALYCSTSDVAFGPVFSRDKANGHDADERADAFLEWLNTTETWSRYEKVTTLFDGYRRDARTLSDSGLQSAYSDWLLQEAEQWKKEEAATFDEA